MTWRGWGTLCVVVSIVCGVGSVGHAAEQASTVAKATGGAGEPLATSEGSIVAVDLKSDPPSLMLNVADGSVVTFVLDPNTTSVSKAGESVGLEGLKVDDRVTVHHTLKDGKAVAESISIAEPPKPAATTDASPSSATAEPTTPASDEDKTATP